MHWELSDEQQLFATSLREWIGAKFSTETVRDLQSSGDTAGFTSALIGEGWWGVGYPEEVGGQGGGVLELALAAREFGRAAVPDSTWLAAALAAPTLTDDELAEQLSGTKRFAVAVRGDRIPTLTPLPVDGDRFTGVVKHVLGAVDADVFLVPVAGEDGVGLMRVSASDAVVTPQNPLDRSRAVGIVEFTDAPVGEIVAVTPSALERMQTLAAVLVAADALGAAEQMLELSVDYSKQRKQFGQLIGAFQAVKHAAAQMLVTVEASYSIVVYAAAAADAGLENSSTSAAVAKAQVTKSVAELADMALTVHGAIGYTWEHDLQLFYKRANLDRSLLGTPKVWNELVADELLSAPV